MVENETREDETLEQNSHDGESNQPQNGDNKCQNCLHSFRDKLANITVEPVVFIYAVSGLLTASLITNLLLERVCLITFNETAAVCKNISTNSSLQHEVQQYTARISMYSSLISTLPSLWIGLFVGAYSDRHGRRLPLILPCIGNTIQCLAYMGFAYFSWINPVWSLVCAIPNGLTGGFAVFLMGSFTHITDISKTKSRTGRVGLVNISLSLGAPAGLFLSGFIFQTFGYWPVYLIAACLNIFNIIYVSIFIQNYVCNSNQNNDGTLDQPLLKYVWHTTKLALYACSRPRPLYTRAALYLLVISLLIMVTSFNVSKIYFLFTNLKFGWMYTPFIRYSIVSILIETLGTTIFLGLFTKFLKVNDFILGLITGAFRIVSYVICAFASTPAMMYVSAAVNIGGLIPAIIIRSSLSKIISTSELGKVFAIISSLECLIPILADPLFTFVYTATLTTMPGAVFLVAGVLTFLLLICFVGLLILQQKHLYEEYNESDLITTPLLDEEQNNDNFEENFTSNESEHEIPAINVDV